MARRVVPGGGFRTTDTHSYGHGHLPGNSDPFVVRLPGSAPPRPGERLTVRAGADSSTSSTRRPAGA